MAVTANKKSSAGKEGGRAGNSRGRQAGAKAGNGGRAGNTGRANPDRTGQGSRKSGRNPVSAEEENEDFIGAEVLVILSFAAGVLLFLSNFHLCGAAGQYLRAFQLGIFGSVGFIAPFLLFVGTCFYLSNRGNMTAMRKLLACVAAVLVLCGFAQLLFGKDPEQGSGILEYYRMSSQSGTGGGLTGGLICWGLTSVLGNIGAFLVLTVCFAISAVCITERSLVNAVKRQGDAAYRYAREDLERRREERAERQEERRLQKEQRVRGVNLGSTDLGAQEEIYEDYGSENEFQAYDSAPQDFGNEADMPVQGNEAFVGNVVKAETAVPEGRPAEKERPVGGEREEKKEKAVDPADIFVGKIMMPPGNDREDRAPFDVDKILTPAESAQLLVAEGISHLHDFEGSFGKPLKPPAFHTPASEPSFHGLTGVLDGKDAEEDHDIFMGEEPKNRAGQLSRPVEEPARGERKMSLWPEEEPSGDEGLSLLPEEEPSGDEGPSLWIEKKPSGDEGWSLLPEEEPSGYRGSSLRPEGEPTGRERLSPRPEEKLAGDEGPSLWSEGEPTGGKRLSYWSEGEPSGREEMQIWSEEDDWEEVQEDRQDRTFGRQRKESGFGDFVIPEESKRVVTSSGKVIDSDTEALHKRLESKRREVLEERQAGEISVQQQIREKETLPKREYVFPPVTLLKRGNLSAGAGSQQEYKDTAIKLQQTLRDFGVGVTVTNISCGPSVTRYELHPEQGVKVSRIVGLADDIKLSLAAADIRIEAPIPGKSAVGIEVPNKENTTVYLRELLESEAFREHPSQMAFAVGKDIGGQVVVTDIAKMPHLLIAGATGSGKSVCINTLIMSILFKASPDEVKLIMVDPKVVELSVYNGIPHLLIPVVTDPKKASGALNWAVAEMQDRYKKFAECNVRNLKGYNSRVEKLGDDVPEEKKPKKLPQIVIIVDELADLMMVAPGEVEDAICRLAQLARAAGIHLVIATQRPSVNVITGLIKANVPSRIAFSVSSGVDSRTIIDMNGAEKLLGKGDMLFFPSGIPKPVRVQGAFVSDTEVQQVVEFLSEQGLTAAYDPDVEKQMSTAVSASGGGAAGGGNGRDEYFEQAGRFIIEKDKASIGMLQRMFKIGFNRAARIMDQLADAGVVGEDEGTKPRKVLVTMEEFEELL